ncbi:MAG: redoxin domain-containing protein [Alphaproteobacteria bacterium]|nr:redoxin domain-containing protein [Alphaproteobacteria bacterium]
MFPRRTLLLAGLAGTIAGRSHASATIGEPAPDFDRPDIDGQRVRLSAMRGRIVALEWSNPLCPFAGKHYTAGTMQALQREARDVGGAWLTVFSDPPDAVGHVSDLEAELVAEQRKSRATAILLDHDTSLARTFGARNTPHIFIVDRAGRLAYAGGMDSIASTRVEDIAQAEPFARDALRAVIAGRPVERPLTKPYGCPIKYV